MKALMNIIQANCSRFMNDSQKRKFFYGTVLTGFLAIVAWSCSTETTPNNPNEFATTPYIIPEAPNFPPEPEYSRRQSDDGRRR
ncbi:MAG: hypothetical protein U5K79_13800 [Cyclobacteriaceae bacterium]|nr:hypothetical protein [Cyclobacteriaceae bacterium]